LRDLATATASAIAMSRYLSLLGLHFVLNFGLLAGNAVVSHPVHHDDYWILAEELDQFTWAIARPVSRLVITLVAALSDAHAFLLLNLLSVACLYLCIRFVELFVRRGEALPALGFIAAGAIGLSFAQIVDWTKYFGLLTNLSSALLGLGSLCAIAAADNDEARANRLCAIALVLAAASFFAKEDFAPPLLVATGCIAVARRSPRWAGMTVAIAALFVAALAFNRAIGSAFVLGSRTTTDPYFVDLSPVSIATALARMLAGSAHGRLVVLVCIVASLAAIVLHRRDRVLALKFASLVAIGIAVLGANSILPNHAFAYYAFTAIALLAATLAGAFYAIEARLR
jgi:hypothetical protein